VKKYLHIEAREMPDGITDEHKASSYPGQGLYRGKDGYLRFVTEGNVDTLYYGLPEDAVINDHPGGNQGITETLLLKAIAAASRAEVLK
jgi:hypothetical protein